MILFNHKAFLQLKFIEKFKETSSIFNQTFHIFATKNLHDIQVQHEDYVQFESDSSKTFNLIQQRVFLLLSLINELNI